jgi:hypothetical protein
VSCQFRFCLPFSLRSSREVPGFGSASIKGTWEFKKGTTGAVLLMHNPRIKGIASDVLGKLARIRLLQHMHLVTSTFHCHGYFLYLSDKSECAIPRETICAHSSTGGDKISTALLVSAPIADGGSAMAWRNHARSGILRCAYNTEHCFIPLYDLMHVRTQHYRQSLSLPKLIPGKDL